MANEKLSGQECLDILARFKESNLIHKKELAGMRQIINRLIVTYKRGDMTASSDCQKQLFIKILFAKEHLEIRFDPPPIRDHLDYAYNERITPDTEKEFNIVMSTIYHLTVQLR